jgi:serine/threonine protein kinase
MQKEHTCLLDELIASKEDRKTALEKKRIQTVSTLLARTADFTLADKRPIFLSSLVDYHDVDGKPIDLKCKLDLCEDGDHEKATGEQVIVKSFKSSKQFTAELEIMLAVRDNPLFVQILNAGISGDNGFPLWFSMERALGDLLSDLQGRCTYRVKEIKHTQHQILLAVNYLHENGIFHGDIKLDNVLRFPGGQVKLCDFGHSYSPSRPIDQSRQCYTIGSVPPEAIVFTGDISFKSDMWALGVLFIDLRAEQRSFCGKIDFPHLMYIFGKPSKLDWPELYKKYEEHNLHPCRGIDAMCRKSFHENYLSPPNPNERTLLDSMFEMSPRRRISSAQALLHVYFTEEGSHPEDETFFRTSFV